MQILIGQKAFSKFRTARIINRIQPIINDCNITTRFIYFLDKENNEALAEEHLKKLHLLLNTNLSHMRINLQKNAFIITPRLGTISPWSSKASDILHHCGFSQIKRVERGIYYEIEESTLLSEEILKKCAELIYDPMTESILLHTDEIVKLFSEPEETSFSSITIDESGIQALEAANKQFDRTDTAYKQALAEVVQKQASVENARINLGYCYVYSPIDGMIGKINVDVGNLVGGAEDTLLATVVKLNPIYVEFSPSVSDFGEFLKFKKPGDPFKVNVYLPKYPKKIFFGEVDLINNEADTKTATILMRATIDNEKKLLLPGLYVNLELILKSKFKALIIPEIAVIAGQGVDYVYIVNANGVVERKNVTTNQVVNGERVITSGLAAGEIVITSNLEKIIPGEKVDYRLEKNN